MRRERTGKQVQSVTSAGLSHSDDIALRERRYMMTQSVRLLCLVLATALPVPIVYRGLLVAGAIVLPWFGVVMANAGPTRGRARTSAVVTPPAVAPTPRVEITSRRIIDQD